MDNYFELVTNCEAMIKKLYIQRPLAPEERALIAKHFQELLDTYRNVID